VNEPSEGRTAGWLILIAVIALLSFASRFSGGGRPPRNAVFRWDTAISELITFGVILAVVLALAAGLSKRETFALRRPLSWRRALWIGLAVLVAVQVASQALDPLLHPGREQGLTPTGWDGHRAAQFVANFAVLAVVGPVVEELTFRGLGFRLLERYGRWAAILGTGIAFGIWHGLVYALPVLALFGVGLAYLRDRTRSVYPGIALHVTFNALALLYSVL
jgi:membrane protease YdiL (CAAX protease family)